MSINWYAIDKHGRATLCASEEDADLMARQYAEEYRLCAPYRAAQLAEIPTGWKLVPICATEDQFTGLARDIVMWSRFPAPHYGSALHSHLDMIGREIPAWLVKMIPNIDHTPPKGAVAEAIYRAMCEDAPEPMR